MAENKSVEAPIEPHMYSLSHCKHGKAPTGGHDQVTSIKMRRQKKRITPSPKEKGEFNRSQGWSWWRWSNFSEKLQGGISSVSVLQIPVPVLKSFLSTTRVHAPLSKSSVLPQHHTCVETSSIRSATCCQGEAEQRSILLLRMVESR